MENTNDEAKKANGNEKNTNDTTKKTNNRIEIGKRVAELRDSAGLSQEKLAEKVGKVRKNGLPNLDAISKLENGKYGGTEPASIKFDALALLRDIAAVLNTTLDFLLFGDETKKDAAVDETKKDAVAVKDSAARVPIRCDMTLVDIARSISSVALSLPEDVCSLFIHPVKTISPLGDNDYSLALSLSINLYTLTDDEEHRPVPNQISPYLKDYFGEFDKLLRARSLFSEKEIVNKAENISKRAVLSLPCGEYGIDGHVLSGGYYVPF